MSECGFEREIHAYHDGELPEEVRRRVEEHIRHCPACARELEGLRKLAGLLAAASVPDMSVEAVERLRSGARVPLERALVPMAERFAAAAALVLLGCAIWLSRSNGGGSYQDAAQASWETAAVSLRADLATSNDPVAHTGQWIVTDLARGGASD